MKSTICLNDNMIHLNGLYRENMAWCAEIFSGEIKNRSTSKSDCIIGIHMLKYARKCMNIMGGTRPEAHHQGTQIEVGHGEKKTKFSNGLQKNF